VMGQLVLGGGGVVRAAWDVCQWTDGLTDKTDRQTTARLTAPRAGEQ